jgi:dimethylhistidine N-methyltransferase
MISEQLGRDYPQLEVLPVCADFTRPFDLPRSTRQPSHVAVYFPGSTIGNFLPGEVRSLLKQLAGLCGAGGGLLIGIDLKKDRAIIEAAYNDAQGATDQFNLNLLVRINGELEGNFDCSTFRHVDFYNEKLGRVEIFLESLRDQTAAVADRAFHFTAGERILTEYSHKYTIPEFAAMAADAHLTLRRFWTDHRDYFGVLHFALL